MISLAFWHEASGLFFLSFFFQSILGIGGSEEGNAFPTPAVGRRGLGGEAAQRPEGPGRAAPRAHGSDLRTQFSALLAWVPQKVEPETKFKCRYLLHW